MAGRKWTPEEIKEQRWLFQEGSTPAEAAASTGRTKAAVAILRQRRGWKTNGHRPKIDPLKRSMVIDLMSKGLGLREAARVLKKNYATVWKTVDRLVKDGVLVKTGHGHTARYSPSKSWRTK